MCLYSQTHFLYLCDIWTTSEVSQLFRWINHGSRSSYLTFTVLTQYFVVLFFHLFDYLEEISNRLVPAQTALFSPCAPSHLLSASPGKLNLFLWFAFVSVKIKSTLPKVKWFMDSFPDIKQDTFVCAHLVEASVNAVAIVTDKIPSIVLSSYGHNQCTFFGNNGLWLPITFPLVYCPFTPTFCLLLDSDSGPFPLLFPQLTLPKDIFTAPWLTSSWSLLNVTFPE